MSANEFPTQLFINKLNNGALEKEFLRISQAVVDIKMEIDSGKKNKNSLFNFLILSFILFYFNTIILGLTEAVMKFGGDKLHRDAYCRYDYMKAIFMSAENLRSSRVRGVTFQAEIFKELMKIPLVSRCLGEFSRIGISFHELNAIREYDKAQGREKFTFSVNIDSIALGEIKNSIDDMSFTDIVSQIKRVEEYIYDCAPLLAVFFSRNNKNLDLSRVESLFGIKVTREIFANSNIIPGMCECIGFGDGYRHQLRSTSFRGQVVFYLSSANRASIIPFFNGEMGSGFFNEIANNPVSLRIAEVFRRKGIAIFNGSNSLHGNVEYMVYSDKFNIYDYPFEKIDFDSNSVANERGSQSSGESSKGGVYKLGSKSYSIRELTSKKFHFSAIAQFVAKEIKIVGEILNRKEVLEKIEYFIKSEYSGKYDNIKNPIIAMESSMVKMIHGIKDPVCHHYLVAGVARLLEKPASIKYFVDHEIGLCLTCVFSVDGAKKIHDSEYALAIFFHRFSRDIRDVIYITGIVDPVGHKESGLASTLEENYVMRRAIDERYMGALVNGVQNNTIRGIELIMDAKVLLGDGVGGPRGVIQL